MSKLLAPNGKPSNLTAEQYKLVRTPAFKKWFGFWDLYAYGKAKNYYEPSVKKIAKELKEEKLSAINKAVDFLSKQVTENDVLIPMPSRYGFAKDTRKLAQKISEKTGAKLFDCLVGKKRESVYKMKKNNQDLSNFDFNFQINCEIPKAKNYFIVDNVIGTGVTMKNALQNVIKNIGTNVSPLVFAIDLNNISKVVDSNYEPLVVYHGTENKFNIFKISNFGQLGKGIYFSNYYNEAKGYSELNNSKKAKVIGVFLNIKNPKYSTNYELKNSELFMGESNEVYERLINLRYDGIIFKFEKTTSRGDKYISLPTGQLEINAFKPNQIKLADGTNTTFNSNNPDIRFAGGGEIENEKYKIINSIDYLELQKFIKNDLGKKKDLNVIKDETIKFVNKIFSLKNSDNTIYIYREMYVDNDYLKKLLNGEEVKLGHYWSYNKDKAESWDVADTKNKKNVMFCSKVDFDKIDWEHTMYLYYTFGEEEIESELALKNKRPSSIYTENIDVELVYIEVDNEKLYWNDIERKKYKLEDGGEVNTGLFSQIWEWFGIKF